MSTRTSYYTIRGDISDHETVKLNENSPLKYFSMSSLDPWITPPSSIGQISSIGDNSRRQSPTNFIEHKNRKSSNYIVLNLESVERINLANNPYKF